MRRTLRSLLVVFLQPVGTANKAIEVIQILASLLIAVGMAAALVGSAVGVVKGFFPGFYGGLAFFFVVMFSMMSWAAYRFARQLESKENREAIASNLGQVYELLTHRWRDGDQIKYLIEHDWKAGREHDEEIWSMLTTETLERTCPRYAVAFLNDGFPDGGIQTPDEWPDDRKRAFRNITVRLHRLKEDVLDRLDTERQVILARHDR